MCPPQSAPTPGSNAFLQRSAHFKHEVPSTLEDSPHYDSENHDYPDYMTLLTSSSSSSSSSEAKSEISEKVKLRAGPLLVEKRAGKYRLVERGMNDVEQVEL